jgi:hypothetical protein
MSWKIEHHHLMYNNNIVANIFNLVNKLNKYQINGDYNIYNNDININNELPSINHEKLINMINNYFIKEMGKIIINPKTGLAKAYELKMYKSGIIEDKDFYIYKGYLIYKFRQCGEWDDPLPVKLIKINDLYKFKPMGFYDEIYDIPAIKILIKINNTYYRFEIKYQSGVIEIDGIYSKSFIESGFSEFNNDLISLTTKIYHIDHLLNQYELMNKLTNEITNIKLSGIYPKYLNWKVGKYISYNIMSYVDNDIMEMERTNYKGNIEILHPHEPLETGKIRRLGNWISKTTNNLLKRIKIK